MGDDNHNGVPSAWDDEEENLFPIPNFPANLQRIRLSPDSSDSQEGRSNSSQSSLLGLSLKKTPSFMNLVERTLQVAGAGADDYKQCPKKQDEKMKASNFPAFFLKIGKWQKVTRYEGDLTVKVYYAKKKLVWEILDGALKNKIEIQWADISAIRAHTPENEPGTLHIELERPPSFFRELNPQPKKHTIWNPGSDFTGGQAPIWRRHCVKFSPGVLDKHFEKLLMNDPRLLALSRSPFPSHSSPYFDTTMYRVSQLSLLLNNFESGSSNLAVDTNTAGSSSQLLQQYYQPNNAGVGVMQQQVEFDQNELQPPMQLAAAVDEEVDQATNSWLGMNSNTYYNGGNPNLFRHEFTVAPIHSLLPPPPPQQEAHYDVFPQHTEYQDFYIPSPPQPQPQPQPHQDQDLFPQPIMNYQHFPPQQEAQHDIFQQHMSTYQHLPPQPRQSQQEGHHDFIHVNYQVPPPPQQEPQHDLLSHHVNYLQLPPPPLDQPHQEPQYDLSPHHVNYQLPPPPEPQPQRPPHQYLGDDDVSLFMQQHRRSTNYNSYFY